ncbi:MAG: hypothetical protein KF841_08905 [Phycisphaerae bacterium]|nr:hypothetical protein [Phycisphaerae bacterium]
MQKPSRPNEQNVNFRISLGRVTTFTAVAALIVSGCTGIDLFLGPLLGLGNQNNNNSIKLGIAIAEPNAQVNASAGVLTPIRWADIASIEGTVVRITAQRRNIDDEDTADPIHLVGDGTTGSGRDALADGDNDIFQWDVAGVRVGTYVIIATIESPDGETRTVQSRDADRGTNGTIVVTTALPVPTLSFTDPGNADVTVTAPTPFTIMWTDNGPQNPDALVSIKLDLDTNHNNGNEITLVSAQPLSENGASGSFVFNFVDENGDSVPSDTYNLFAVIDDGVNDPVTVNAVGQLVVVN